MKTKESLIYLIPILALASITIGLITMYAPAATSTSTISTSTSTYWSTDSSTSTSSSTTSTPPTTTTSTSSDSTTISTTTTPTTTTTVTTTTSTSSDSTTISTTATTTTTTTATTTTTTTATTTTSTTTATTSTSTTSNTTTTVPGEQCCEPFCTISVENGEYIIQNNVWGATTSQCVWSTGYNAFKVTVSEHDQNSVASYPSVYKGCYRGLCTNNSGLPFKVSDILSAPFSWSVHGLSYVSGGTWNVAAKAWFSPTADTNEGYDGGAEMTIWLYSQNMTPSGSQVGTVSIEGISWDIWYSPMNWNYVVYKATSPRTSINADLKPFINDAVSRGYIQTSWYLHVMEAGFEIMAGGQNLMSDPFSFVTTTTSTTTTATSTTSTTSPWTSSTAGTTTTTVPVTSTAGTTTAGSTTTAG